MPLWVKQTTDKDAANADLVAKGGRWLEADSQAFTISNLMSNEGGCESQLDGQMGDLFSMPAQSELFSEPESNLKPQSELEEDPTESENEVAAKNQENIEAISEQITENEAVPAGAVDFYQVFTSELQRFAEEAVAFDELVEITQLHKTQLTEWLKRAVDDGVVKKLNRPVRYQVKNKE